MSQREPQAADADRTVRSCAGGGARVALVHDWLTGMRGGEKVLEALCEMHPDADIFTLFYTRGALSDTIERHRIHASALQALPFAKKYYRRLLPLYPLAIEQFDLDPYDLVLSVSHCAAKAVVTNGRARHICYCNAPMRYAWDQFDAYFGPDRVGPFASRWIYRPMLARLARWDAATASRVDRFIANSRNVAARIRRYYSRDATVVYPPVDTQFYHPDTRPPGSHFLIVSALVPYKRIDLAIDACRRAGARLRIVGDGPDRERLEQRAHGPSTEPGTRHVEFIGRATDEEIREEYRNALAVLLPGEEDFGIVPLESQACGRPVVALARGGALETVIPGETGVFFDEPTAESMAVAINEVARMRVDAEALRRNAERFSRANHVNHLRAVIDETVAAPPETTW